MTDLTNFSSSLNVPPISERLSKGLKIIAMNNYTNPLEAAMEIIDNSIDERDSGHPPMILDISFEKNKLTFFDSHSLGMGYKELSNFLNWGFSSKRFEHGKIGKFGAGGKGAIGYLGVGCQIKTKRSGEDIIWRLTEPDWRNEELKVFKPIPEESQVPLDIGFTQIDITGVDKKICKRDLEKMLGHIYRPLLEEGLIEIQVGKVRVSPFRFPLDETEPVQQIDTITKHGKIKGWFAKLAQKTGIRGGIRCYYNGRLITRDYKKIHEFFGHPDPQNVASMNYLIGEVHLDFVPVLPNKSDFNRGSEEWILAEKIMNNLLAPIVAQLKSRKEEIEITEEDTRNLPEVENLVKKALQNYEKEPPQGELPATGNLRGRKPPDEPSTPGIINPEGKSTDRSKPSPLTPPPPGAIGKLIRRQGFPMFEVQVGDGLSRSAQIEKEGVKKIIFYRSFPEYLFRNGDVMYKAEAAIMQLAKPLAEEEILLPDQYLSLIDDLMREVCRAYNELHKTKKNTNFEDLFS